MTVPLAMLLAIGLAAGWETTGPELRFASSIAVAASDDRRLFAVGSSANDSGAVFRSRDGGASWEAVLATGAIVVDFTYDPRDPHRLVAAAFLGSFSGYRTLLYRSLDGGETWTEQLSVFGSFSCRTEFDAVRTDTLYAACDNPSRFFQSEDGGETFVERFAPFLGDTPLQASPDGALLAVSQNGLFRTRDGGATWQDLGIIPSACGFGIRTLAIDTSDPNRMFAGTGLEAFPCGSVLRTHDGGATWSESPHLDAPVSDIRIDSAEPSVVYAATFWDSAPPPAGPVSGKVLMSADGGETWRDLRLPVSAGASGLAVTADGRRLYAATPSGVYSRSFREPRILSPRRPSQ